MRTTRVAALLSVVVIVGVSFLLERGVDPGPVGLAVEARPSRRRRRRGSARVHLNHVRRKLGDDGGRPLLIVNEPGLSYRWLPEPDDPPAARAKTERNLLLSIS